MERARPSHARKATRISFALFAAAVLCVLACPTPAHAEVVGYCSELALSDIAPAPMIPASRDVLEDSSASAKQTMLDTAPSSDDGPRLPTWTYVDRVLPAGLRWSAKQAPERVGIETGLVLRLAGFDDGVYRPPR